MSQFFIFMNVIILIIIYAQLTERPYTPHNILKLGECVNPVTTQLQIRIVLLLT